MFLQLDFMYMIIWFQIKTHLQDMYTHPSTAEQCLHNALKVVNAMRHIGIDYDIQVICHEPSNTLRHVYIYWKKYMSENVSLDTPLCRSSLCHVISCERFWRLLFLPDLNNLCHVIILVNTVISCLNTMFYVYDRLTVWYDFWLTGDWHYRS